MTAASSTLDEKIVQQVRQCCQSGYQAYDRGELKLAIRHFYRAWHLLPKPQYHYEQAGWVLTALGDAYFIKGNYSSAIEALQSALHCPAAQSNPFIHMRLGQSHFDNGEIALARQHFRQAIAHGGQPLLEKQPAKYQRALQRSIAD